MVETSLSPEAMMIRLPMTGGISDSSVVATAPPMALRDRRATAAHTPSATISSRNTIANWVLIGFTSPSRPGPGAWRRRATVVLAYFENYTDIL